MHNYVVCNDQHRIIGTILLDSMVNTEQYKKVLENDFILIIQSAPDFGWILMWFMEDRAQPRHQSKRVFDVLEEHFGGHILVLGYP